MPPTTGIERSVCQRRDEHNDVPSGEETGAFAIIRAARWAVRRGRSAAASTIVLPIGRLSTERQLRPIARGAIATRDIQAVRHLYPEPPGQRGRRLWRRERPRADSQRRAPPRRSMECRGNRPPAPPNPACVRETPPCPDIVNVNARPLSASANSRAERETIGGQLLQARDRPRATCRAPRRRVDTDAARALGQHARDDRLRVLPACGGSPVSISYSTAPSE